MVLREGEQSGPRSNPEEEGIRDPGKKLYIYIYIFFFFLRNSLRLFVN